MATAKITELNESNTCKLCQNAAGKYVCPKCDILYCSLSCYRSQSHLSCSEQFYKDSVIEELKLNERNPEEQRKIVSILRSSNDPKMSDILTYPNDNGSEFSPEDTEDMESCDSDDDKDYLSLHERLAGIDLDDTEQVWANLDEDERKEFIAMTQEIKAKNIVHDWKPWWTHFNNIKVQELDFDSNLYKTKCPKLIDISKFKDICKQNTHISVKFNLYNILAGYVFVARYFNGEYTLFPAETISLVATIASSLRCHQNFMNFESGLESIENQIIENGWINNEPDSMSIMEEDLKKIISGPTVTDGNYYVLSSLCDIYNLLKRALSKEENGVNIMARAFIDEHFPSSKIHSTKEIRLYRKRIEYFLSYVQNFYTN